MTNSDETAGKVERENDEDTATVERERERRKREVFRRASSNLMASSEGSENKSAD